jgi:glycosyltransferase 2 family protein
MPDNRVFVKIFGNALVLMAFYFILNRLWDNWETLVAWQPKNHLIWLIGLDSLIFGMGCFLLSTAWGILLNWCSGQKVSLKLCHAIYGRTQLAKYIPGNIFHFVGRHVYGREAGLKHLPLICASGYEMLGVLFAASVMSLPGLLLLDEHLITLSPLSVLGILIIVMILIFGLSILAPRVLKTVGYTDLPVRSVSDLLMGLGSVYMIYILFFLIYGAILVAIVYAVHDFHDVREAGIIMMTFSVAWIAGFITPGAPAGLGVREAIIVALLTQLMDESQSLMVAFLFRLVSLFGDILFFALTYPLHNLLRTK